MSLLVELDKLLLEVGLPPHALLLGAPFVFGDAESGHCISGTVTSIGYAPKEGILLYVTPPRYKGMRLRRIAQIQGVWTAIGFEVGEDRAGTLEMQT